MAVIHKHMPGERCNLDCKDHSGKAIEEDLLQREYKPPELFIWEEVELYRGYHTYAVTSGPERGWSDIYRKSSSVMYRNRVVKVPYPPVKS